MYWNQRKDCVPFSIKLFKEKKSKKNPVCVRLCEIEKIEKRKQKKNVYPITENDLMIL